MVYSLKRGFVVVCAVLSCKTSSHVYASAKHYGMYEPLGSHCGVREKTRECVLQANHFMAVTEGSIGS